MKSDMKFNQTKCKDMIISFALEFPKLDPIFIIKKRTWPSTVPWPLLTGNQSEKTYFDSLFPSGQKIYYPIRDGLIHV